MIFRMGGFLLVFGLLAFPALAQKNSKPDYETELKRLQDQYQAAYQKFVKPIMDAKTEAEREKINLDWDKSPAHDYVPKYMALAKRAKGTETAAKSLLEAMRMGREANRKEDTQLALKMLLAEHVKSPVMKGVAGALQYMGWFIGQNTIENALKTIIDKSPLPAVQAAAYYTLGCVLMQNGGNKSKQIEAKSVFEKLKKSYADTQYAKTADANIFELEHLQIGMTAPDIEATDQEGKSWRLSDYRGKVVVMDFWGFWGDPCRMMIPNEKEMVKRLANKSFALLGINSDGDRSVVNKILEKEHITWRQAIDVTTNGAIAAHWNVHAWPTIYVLDHKGVIRFRDLRDKQLEDAVLTLLKEMENNR